VYCAKVVAAGDDKAECPKLWKFLIKGKCSAFRYDPVKHELMLNPDAITPKQKDDEKTPESPEPPTVPDPPEPPTVSTPPEPPTAPELPQPPTIPVPPELPTIPAPPVFPKRPVRPVPPMPPRPPVLPKSLNFTPSAIAPVPPLSIDKSNAADSDADNPDKETKSKWEQKMESFYTDEEKVLWAKSTLKEFEDIEDLVKVYEIGAGLYAKKETIRNRTWIHDLFDDTGLHYHIEIEGKSQGKQFAETQVIYVKPEDKDLAFFLIMKFNQSEFVKPEFSPEIVTQNMVDGIPQKQCQSCNEEIDFDFHTCPHCKSAV
jgi:hypothetical protein